VNKEEGTAFGVHFPDVPGCFSASDTEDDLLSDACEALLCHVKGGEVPAASKIDRVRKLAADDLAAGAFLLAVPYIESDSTVERVNLSLEAGVLKAIDATAKSRNMTRSAFVVHSARNEIEARIQEKVMSNHNRSDYIAQLVSEDVNRFESDFLKGRHGFVLQATPVEALNKPWDVLGNRGYADSITGGSRVNKYQGGIYSLFCSPAPVPGINMLRTRDSYDEEKVCIRSEIHTDGRILSAVLNTPNVSEAVENKFVSHRNQLFCAFGDMVDEALSVDPATVGYVINCTYCNAAGLQVYIGEHGGSYHDPTYPVADRITWPSIVVPAGETANSACRRMGEVMYHACGHHAPPNLATQRAM